MNTEHIKWITCCPKIMLFILLTISYVSLFPQTLRFINKSNTHALLSSRSLFNKYQGFTENIGQYNDASLDLEQSGPIIMGFEGLGGLVLFTSHGITFVQRKNIDPAAKQRNDEKGMLTEEIWEKQTESYSSITLEWEGANPSPKISKEERIGTYHTYGLLNAKAFLYKKVIYKNMYPGIDIIYSIDEERQGFEYSLLIHPGGNPDNIKLLCKGDIQNISKKDESLVIRTEGGSVLQSVPICFYDKNKRDHFSAGYVINKKRVSFKLPSNYDKSRPLTIDPFVSSTGSLVGTNDGIAKDIDYDYAGNVYVSGGGDWSVHQLAKFDQNGVLQWVFNGVLGVPDWSFGHSYGGWVVEKSTGNIYLGQGVDNISRVIRLTTDGLYDNFITDGDQRVSENWKMTWYCNGVNPQLIQVACGGGVISNINIGIISPPSTTVAFRNITGISAQANPTPPPYAYGIAQDIADIITDPVTNELYTIYASAFTANLSNRIYKHKYPYTAADKLWDTLSGFVVLQEHNNRPYLVSNGPSSDNSANLLALNSHYLFYWDGEHLKAFDKATGAGFNNALIFNTNDRLERGGIIADECDNVFVGTYNGTIKVYHFTPGGGFDDSPPDIQVPGYLQDTVYDLAYNATKKLLYACGSGFVASFDISAYCATTPFTLNVSSNCVAGTATATLSPSTTYPVTYNLYASNSLLASNSTGLFTNLVNGLPYTIIATINPTCGGPQAIKDFTMGTLINLSATPSNTACGTNTGSIAAIASGGTSPYQYSINGGVTWQGSGTFNNLGGGSYTILAKDATPCGGASMQVNILVNNSITLSGGNNTTICKGDTTMLSATTNATNYAWSPSTGLSDTTILNPKAFPTVTTKYYITATMGPCSKKDSVKITVRPPPLANAGKDTTVCFGKDVQLNGMGGITYAWIPALYLNNASVQNPLVIKPPEGIHQYSLKVTDVFGCHSFNNAVVTIKVNAPARLFAGNDTSVAINQPVQLHAFDINNIGFINYLWSPAYGLNNAAVQNPVATLDRDITYFVSGITFDNCAGKDTIVIKVFKGPAIYVPNAFSPNGDGLNDILKAIPIGMKEFRHFSIYNRYGQVIFTTTNATIGWNGTLNGTRQPAGTYTWEAEAVDWNGTVVIKKGTTILLR